MRLAPVLAITVVAWAAVTSSNSPKIVIPDPNETVNLWAHFIASNSVDGAVALTYAAAISEPATLRGKYASFVQRAITQDRRPIALGHEIAGYVAIVHCYDGPLQSGRPDIDPAFLIHDGEAWKLLPILGNPRSPLDYLDKVQNQHLADLFRAYSKVSHKLGDRYEHLLNPARSNESQ